jgi:hypothetical protein
MITVPFSVAIVIVVLAVIIWVSELAKKARRRRDQHVARQRLAVDLTAPKPSTQLPYGLSAPEGPDAGAQNSETN